MKKKGAGHKYSFFLFVKLTTILIDGLKMDFGKSK